MIFGILFSISWTPCIGTFLGSALLLIAKEQEVVKGIILMLLYSIGLGIPFIISVLLTLIAGLIPSRVASKKDPVIALRTE